MKSDILRFDNTLEHDPAIGAWMRQHSGPLGDIARHYFEIMRACGDEVREVLHDGCPNACFGDAPFAYVNVFTAHVNVGFFQGALLRDPKGLLQGTGKRMRHIKLSPASQIDEGYLRGLIEAAYAQIKSLVEQG